MVVFGGDGEGGGGGASPERDPFDGGVHRSFHAGAALGERHVFSHPVRGHLAGAGAELAAAVRANEPGNVFYALTRSRSNPQVYKVLEQYVDQDALTAHGASDYLKAAGPKLGPCLAGAPDIEYLDAV